MQLSKLLPKYQKKWTECQVTQGIAAENIAKRIIANKDKYEMVAKSVEYIPWWLIGCLHNMESGMRFNGHASNGDPLTARTVQVPKGEPRDMGEPPYTWEETAISIYRQKKGGLDYLGIYDGSIDLVEEALHFAQAFNGFGYEEGAGRATTPPSSSPYLWAGTNQYVQGKYISDGRFDSRAVSAQIGGAAVMKK
jgi:lysozyme family protein